MGYEVIEDEKEVNMSEQKKLRLADVLGVKEDMEWTFPAIPGSVYRVHHGVRQRKRTDGYWEVCFSEEDLTYMINHPESIIPTPRLTEAELAICKPVGAKWVSRSDSNAADDFKYVKLWEEKPTKNVYGKWEETVHLDVHLGVIDARKFPSVQFGDCICVEEVGGNG